MHLLSEDDDHGFALYAVAAHSASKTPPHDHTTWAVVVGVEGAELNRHWRRVDDGAPPAQAGSRRPARPWSSPAPGSR